MVRNGNGTGGGFPVINHVIVVFTLVFAAVCLWPSVGYFFHGDDFHSFDAPALESAGDIPEVLSYAVSKASRAMHLGIYFSVGKGIWGDNPYYWHLSSIILFLIDTVLLYLLLGQLLRNRLSATLGTCMFALSGAFFYSQFWITGSVELIAAFFVFSSTLFYVWALDGNASRGQRTARNVIALVLLVLVTVSKETMVPVIVLWIIIDLYSSRRISPAGLVAVLIGIGGAFTGWIRISSLREIEGYSVVLKPGDLIVNLLAYFYDPVIGTGGEFRALDLLGHSGGASGTVAEFVSVAGKNPLPAVALVIIALIIAVVWVKITIVPGRGDSSGDTGEKPVVPRWVGWFMWLMLLVPLIVTTRHHYPYYTMVPFGLLMIAIGPAAAAAFTYPKTRLVATILLVVYVAWFPVNTALAFRYSNVTQGTVAVENLLESVERMHPGIGAGTEVVLDGVDVWLGQAIAFGKAVEWRYPGVDVVTFADLDAIIRTRSLNRQSDGPLVILRQEEGGWVDVTGDYEALLQQREDVEVE